MIMFKILGKPLQNHFCPFKIFEIFLQEIFSNKSRKIPECQIVVGGAVLTAEYAAQIGADFYGKDAMETVRIAEKVFGGSGENNGKI